MKIIQIELSDEKGLYGLGDDGVVYVWNPSLKEWQSL
jgi:hypothetical protein